MRRVAAVGPPPLSIGVCGRFGGGCSLCVSVPDRVRQAKGSAGGRPPVFDEDVYRGRNVVERCFARLKQFRGLATRYAKRAAYYATEVTIAAIVLWLR